MDRAHRIGDDSGVGRWAFVLLSLGMFAACDAPVTSIDEPDAGPSALDAGSDSGAPLDDAATPLPLDAGTPDPPTLTLRVAVREYDLGGVRLVPLDARNWRASVSQAGTTLGSARGDADGFIRGLPAPPGERTVIVERPDRVPYDALVVVGTSTVIDLIDARAARDPTPSPGNAGILLDVHGLAPWQDRDRLLLFSGASPDAAIDLAILPYWSECIAAGATRLTSCALDWQRRARLRGREHDDLFLGRYASVDRDDLVGWSLTELARIDEVTLTPGITTTVTGTMARLPSAPLRLRLGDPRERDAILPDPAVSPHTAELMVEQRAPGGRRGRTWWPAPPIHLLLLRWPAADTRAIEAPMPPPIPGFETHVVYERGAWVAHQDARSSQTRVSAGISLPLGDALRTGDLRLPLSAPRDLTVDGQSATGPLRGVSLAPRIAWRAPAFGSPEGYGIALLASRRSDDFTFIQLFTRHAAVDVPAGLLPPDTTDYQVMVTALLGRDVTRAPFDAGPTEAWAVTTSGINFR